MDNSEKAKELYETVRDCYCERYSLFWQCPDDALFCRALSDGIISVEEYELLIKFYLIDSCKPWFLLHTNGERS